MKSLLPLSIFVSVTIGYYGRSLIKMPMIEYSILSVLACSMLLGGIVLVLYLRRELKLQRTRHTERREEYGTSRKVRDLTEDEHTVYQRRVMRSLDMSDRKRLIFQVVRNTLLVMAGLLPMLSTLVEDNRTQKMLSFGASFAAFIVGLFSMDKFTTEHRRAGFLIEKALNEWLVGNGVYWGLPPADAFRELIKEVQLVLDTSETSFIGSGSAPMPVSATGGDVLEVDMIPVTNMEIAEAITDESKESRPPTDTSSEAAIAQQPTAVPNQPTMDVVEQVMPESTTAFTGVKPEGFGAWQTAALASDEYDEITQEGV